MKRTPEREQFLADVLTTAVEGGIQYWATVEEYGHEYCDPPIPVADTFAVITDDEGEEHRVTIDTIAHGIGILTTGENADKAFSMCGMDYWKQFKLSNRTNGEDGDYDADIADNVLQAGIFGEVIYG